MADADKAKRPEPTILKRTVVMKHSSKEGLLKDGGKTIYDDLWLHPDVLDEEHEKKQTRKINSMYRTHKGDGTQKSSEGTKKGLFIDLEKGRQLDRSKLVKRPVQVKGKNGKIFTRMQWVDPKTGQPVSPKSSKKDLPNFDEFHDVFDPSVGNPGKTQKEFIDHHVKKVMSKKQKDDFLAQHDIKWKKHENPQKDRINSIQALKEHLYNNPHLVGADHLPKEDSTNIATGEKDTKSWVDQFTRAGNTAILYQIMKEAGINDGIDPRENKGDPSAPIKHMNFMMKLQKYLKDNPHIMDDPKYDLQPNNKQTATADTPSKEKTSTKPSRAEMGGNTIKGILGSMASDELYKLMKQHGICDGVDPRTIPGDLAAPIKHMNFMMKLRKLVEQDPHILNIDPDSGDLSEIEKERLAGMNDKQKMVQGIKDFMGSMSKDRKQILLDKYKDEPIIKNRPRNDHENIDYKDAMVALRKLYEEKPHLMDVDKPDVEKDTLMSMKIGNKMMARVLRGVCGLKAVGDVTIAEEGTEWSWSRGFVRRDLDDEGEPILSVVEEEDKDGNPIWEEKAFPMSDVKKFVDSHKEGDAEGAAKIAETIKPQDIPLHRKPLPEIYQALHNDFGANYTPEVGDALKPTMRDAFRVLVNNKNTNMSDLNRVSNLSKAMTGMTIEDTAKVLGKMGVKVSPDGTRFDMNSNNWKEVAFSDMVTPEKSKHADDYLITYPNGRVDTWALHKSAKQWNHEERAVARKDLIGSRLNIQDEGIIEGGGKRREHLVRHVHEGLEHVPFDLMSDVMATTGMKIHFMHTRDDGKPSLGCSYNPQDRGIYLDHNYVKSDTLFGGALEHNLTNVTHPAFNKPYRQPPLVDSTAHEFAHAIDHYLTGSDDPQPIPGKWDSPAGEKYAGKYNNVVRDSYNKKIAKSNPQARCGVAQQKNSFILYHEDEFLSWYEGRLYDRKHQGNWARSSNIEVKNNVPYDKVWKQGSEARDSTQYGTEHWSVPSGHYAAAVKAYQQWRSNNPDQSSVGMDSWAKMMHDKFVDMGYHSDKDYNSGLRETSYRYGLNDHPIEGYGYVLHKMNQMYGHLMKGIHHIYDRPDFVDDKKTMPRNELVEQGDNTRKSVGDEDLVIYL